MCYLCIAEASNFISALHEMPVRTSDEKGIRLSVCPSVKRVHCETKNSSGEEIANVNFLYDDIVHAVQNTIGSCINDATDRRGYVLESLFTKFSEITQCNGHYAVQGHSRSVTDFGTNRKLIYDFLLVITTNLPPILHRFQVMADYWSNFG